MPDGAGGFLTPFLAAFDPDGSKTDGLLGKGGDGGALLGKGGEYPESYSHEFEPDSGMGPGGVDLSQYCKHCGVVGSMHGGPGGEGRQGSMVTFKPEHDPGGGWGQPGRGGGGKPDVRGGWGK